MTEINTPAINANKTEFRKFWILESLLKSPKNSILQKTVTEGFTKLEGAKKDSMKSQVSTLLGVMEKEGSILLDDPKIPGTRKRENIVILNQTAENLYKILKMYQKMCISDMGVFLDHNNMSLASTNFYENIVSMELVEELTSKLNENIDEFEEYEKRVVGHFVNTSAISVVASDFEGILNKETSYDPSELTSFCTAVSDSILINKKDKKLMFNLAKISPEAFKILYYEAYKERKPLELHGIKLNTISKDSIIRSMEVAFIKDLYSFSYQGDNDIQIEIKAVAKDKKGKEVLSFSDSQLIFGKRLD